MLVFVLCVVAVFSAECPECPSKSCSCPFGCVSAGLDTITCPSECGGKMVLDACPNGTTEVRTTASGCPSGQRRRVCQRSCPTFTEACLGSPKCADYAGCAALSGDCCPTPTGQRLGCCDSSPTPALTLSPTRKASPTSTTIPSDPVAIANRQLYVDGKAFDVHGVCYSPVPIGESIAFPPYGDYFTLEYAYLWLRDLPLIKQMGANSIRIYGWNTTRDHTDFLDAVHKHGLKILVTYFLGSTKETPIASLAERQAVVDKFAAEAKKYATHPAILAWSFGNEVNGIWNGFITELNNAASCGWSPSCLNNIEPNSPCVAQGDCVYRELFQWIDSAAAAARKVTTRPITTGFADVDFVLGTPNMPALDKLARNAKYMPNLHFWAMQLYRGKSFGDVFRQHAAATSIPLLVSEYGVDAYNDPCMWPENYNVGMCYASTMDKQGGSVASSNFVGCSADDKTLECHRPGSLSQRDWDAALTAELQTNCANRGGVVLGGFLMAWIDEYWKGVNVESKCVNPCLPSDSGPKGPCRNKRLSEFVQGGAAGCMPRSHITCGVTKAELNDHSLCGYFLPSQPDQYLNEEWFGITEPTACSEVDGLGFGLNAISTRPVFHAIKQLWTQKASQEEQQVVVSCKDLTPCYACATSFFVGETNAQLRARCGAVCNLRTPGPLPVAVGGSNPDKAVIVGSLVAAFALVIAALSAAIIAQKRCRRRDEKMHPQFVALH